MFKHTFYLGLKILYQEIYKLTIKRYRLFRLKISWMKNNEHNFTELGMYTDDKYVTVGKKTYGVINVLNYSKKHYLRIGSYCSIAKSIFILHLEHPLNYISSYPFKVMSLHYQKNEAVSKGDIVVSDDVWICENTTVLSGVFIGQGAVIAAGAVVTKDIPPYAIAAGVPAKVIKYRFSQDVISFLLTLDYSQLTEEMIRMHIDDLYTPLDSLSVDQIRSLYSWFPKRKEPIQQQQ